MLVPTLLSPGFPSRPNFKVICLENAYRKNILFFFFLILPFFFAVAFFPSSLHMVMDNRTFFVQPSFTTDLERFAYKTCGGHLNCQGVSVDDIQYISDRDKCIIASVLGATLIAIAAALWFACRRQRRRAEEARRRRPRPYPSARRKKNEAGSNTVNQSGVRDSDSV
ncbi:hypothetical protein GGR50DRAFT_263120 [Xylaria sp. CBS 124048]|nr:hypothetical protein GGR50DRAFT_263120 [Xylaria sp. CBS 124048]